MEIRPHSQSYENFATHNHAIIIKKTVHFTAMYLKLGSTLDNNWLVQIKQALFEHEPF